MDLLVLKKHSTGSKTRRTMKSTENVIVKKSRASNVDHGQLSTGIDHLAHWNSWYRTGIS
jgi:hypothetical protein